MLKLFLLVAPSIFTGNRKRYVKNNREIRGFIKRKRGFYADIMGRKEEY